MLGAMLLSRPKPPQAGAEGQPLQGHRSERPLFTKVSGPPLVAASTPGRRAESTALACEIHPLKIQKSQICPIFLDSSPPASGRPTLDETTARSRSRRKPGPIDRLLGRLTSGPRLPPGQRLLCVPAILLGAKRRSNLD